MSGNSVIKPVTKQDLERVEANLERRIDGVEARLDQRIDGVEARLDIVARQVGTLTERVDTLTERVDTIAATMATRDDLAVLREDMNRDIAQHMEAGFEMMRRLFTAQDDRARSIEDKLVELRRDFTEHTQDMVLHNRA